MYAKPVILFIIACLLILGVIYLFHWQFLYDIQNKIRFFQLEPNIGHFNSILDELLLFFTFISTYFPFLFKFIYQTLYENHIVNYKDRNKLILKNSLLTKLTIHLCFAPAILLFAFKNLLCAFNYLFPTEIVGNNGEVVIFYDLIRWQELVAYLLLAQVYYYFSRNSTIYFDKTQNLLWIDDKQICDLKDIKMVFIDKAGGLNTAQLYLKTNKTVIELKLDWGMSNHDFILEEIADFLKIKSENRYKWFTLM
jgi:hypothetical protein